MWPRRIPSQSQSARKTKRSICKPNSIGMSAGPGLYRAIRNSLVAPDSHAPLAPYSFASSLFRSLAPCSFAPLLPALFAPSLPGLLTPSLPGFIAPCFLVKSPPPPNASHPPDSKQNINFANSADYFSRIAMLVTVARRTMRILGRPGVIFLLRAARLFGRLHDIVKWHPSHNGTTCSQNGAKPPKSAHKSISLTTLGLRELTHLKSRLSYKKGFL